MAKYRIEIVVDDRELAKLKEAGAGDVKRGVRRVLQRGVAATDREASRTRDAKGTSQPVPV